jgi:hypothetical protein
MHVLCIQNVCTEGEFQANSIPLSSARLLRYIRPRSWWSLVSISSTSRRGASFDSGKATCPTGTIGDPPAGSAGHLGSTLNGGAGVGNRGVGTMQDGWRRPGASGTTSVEPTASRRSHRARARSTGGRMAGRFLASSCRVVASDDNAREALAANCETGSYPRSSKPERSLHPNPKGAEVSLCQIH